MSDAETNHARAAPGQTNIEAVLDRFNQRLRTMENQVDEMQSQIKELKQVAKTPAQSMSKQEKYRSIVAKALQNGSNLPGDGYINQDMAAGVAKCTPRYARDLFGELHSAYGWAKYDSSAPASLKITDAESAKAFIGGDDT